MPTFKEDLHLGHSVPTIDTEDIEDGAITEKKMADGSVSTRTIQNGAVTEPKIANRAVTEPKLADWAVSTRTVRDKAISERKLADLSVSTRTIQDKSVTNSKIADSTLSMGKLDNDVQTKIQQGTQRAWTPKGAYDAEAVYDVNDLVYHTDTNSSYISLQANNQGHNPAWQSATGGWWMKVLDGSYVNVMVEELEQAIAQAIEDAQQDISGLISDSQATIDAAVSGANSAAQAANTAANELLNDFQGKGTWVWGYPVYAKPEDIGKGYDRGNIVYHEPTDSSYISRIDGNKTEPTGATNTSWQLLISGSDIGKKDIKKYPTPDPDTVYTLSPNIMYEFGEATALSIRFNNLEIRAGELNEFQFSFISGDLATTLTVPESVVWTSTVSIEANMQYETNIIYNETSDKYFGIIVGWPLDTENVSTNEITEEGE